METVTERADADWRGHGQAAEQLLPLLYDELRQLAARHLANEKPGQTLQATALVHEAYLRLVGSEPDRPWNGRGHFFGAAAEAMRRILVEAARRKGRAKHGGDQRRVEMTDPPSCPDESPIDLLALNDALDRLAEEDATKAELVKLRYFAGLTLEQAAECQGISLATAKRRWAIARAWLYDRIKSGVDG